MTLSISKHIQSHIPLVSPELLPSTDGPGYFYPGQERVSADVEGPGNGADAFPKTATDIDMVYLGTQT